MTPSEHAALMEIHERVQILPTLHDLRKAKHSAVRELVEKLRLDEDGKSSEPANEIRSLQVQSVKKILRDAYDQGRRLSLHMACLEAWEDVARGYPSPKALYQYCHDHETEFLRL